MNIVGVEEYEGQFMGDDGGFSIMVEFAESFQEFRLRPGTPQGLITTYQKAEMRNPADFLEVLGKFYPEMVALITPVQVVTLEYEEVVKALTKYFLKYGEYFA